MNIEKIKKILKKDAPTKEMEIPTKGELVESINKKIIVENDGRQLLTD
jgi:hypothetical protein